MTIEVGSILTGTVTGITNFGAFVEVEPHVTGLVHISEVAHGYVENIKDHLQVGDTVTVKVLQMEQGKMALSIKAATERPQTESARFHQKTKPVKQNKGAFEDKMKSFLRDSEERLSDLKRNTEMKRGGRGGRRA